jgi:hypothetical protein
MVTGSRVRSGTDGAFRLEGLAPGSYTVSVAKSGLANASRSGIVLSDGGEAGPIELVLSDGRTIRGRVIDPAGNAVAGALVLVYPAGSDPSRALGGDGVSDRQGRFVLRNAPQDGALSAIAVGRGLAPAVVEGWMPTEQPDDDDVILPLSVGGTLRVRVVGPDGEPRAGVATSLAADRFDVLARLAQVSSPTPPSDAHGAVVYTALRPGNYTVTASGAQPARAEVTEGSVSEVTIALRE